MLFKLKALSIAVILTGIVFTGSILCAQGVHTPQGPEGTATSVFEKVSKSVVIVEAQTPDGKVQGSGVVYRNNSSGENKPNAAAYWTPVSYVVSNAHVVRNASRVTVLQAGQRYAASIECVDDEFDLVLLSVQGVLFPSSFPDFGSELQVGTKVFAIGSPLGLENSISEGIISGKRQENGVLLLQTTAAISQGSSGGGLFDTKGRFVGVTTFKRIGGENLNFAVDGEYVGRIALACMAGQFLRICVEGQFPPGEAAIIKSDALIKWLVKRDEKGENLSYKLIDRSSKTTNLTEANKSQQEGLQIIARFLADQGGKPPNVQDKSEKVIMVCSVASVMSQ